MSKPADNWEAIGLSGALLKNYAENQKEFVPLLTFLLEEAMPDLTVVERKSLSLFSSKKRIVSITVTLEDNVYVLVDGGDRCPLKARRIKIVKGITLRTDEIDVEQWLSEVGGEINNRAEKSEKALAALRNFLEIKSL
ncbi:MAG: hypothetical protein P4L33_19990 [Capsulimonadaceae bacterium]|nr:hypothetical protein [Capsulimonadaceae bacterium]